MRAVLDTNVVIDLLHFADPRTLALQVAMRNGHLHCYSDRQCREELARVVTYRQFALDAAARGRLLQRYQAFALPCEASDDAASAALPRCRDADDEKFLHLAVRCRADLLITRDRSLLRLAGHRRLPFAILSSDDTAIWLARHAATTDAQPSGAEAATTSQLEMNDWKSP